MQPVATVVQLLFCAIVLGVAARRVNIPYPVALVLGGLLLAFIPGPAVTLDPDLALTLFVPPVLYQAALVASWRDTRENLASIGLLATGLVAFTTIAVAAVTHHLMPEIGWAPAVVLGAIVSPSDAVAATAVMHQFNISRRIVAVVEGESLVNDATGLVFYKYATAAVLAGTFSLHHAASDFLMIGAGGVAIGMVFAWVFIKFQRFLSDPLLESTYSLLLPFAIYISAQYVGVSGVLAVVTAGFFRGHYYPEILSARSRLQGLATWDITVFILNSLSFVLVGLQLHNLVPALAKDSPDMLIAVPIAISLTVIVARVVWVYATACMPRLIGKSAPDAKGVTVVAWTGMRGLVSLATALALPLRTNTGADFPARDHIIYFSFAVILATLVVQGLSLGALIQWLEMSGDRRLAQEEADARVAAARAALEALAEFAEDSSIEPRILHRLRSYYEHRIADLREAPGKMRLHGALGSDAQLRKLRLAAVAAQRRRIIEMRDLMLIADEVMHQIERELDLEELELG